MKRLFIDLEQLLPQKAQLNTIQCEYLFHSQNKGEYSLLEAAEFAVYCRQCKDSHCVRSCPKEALEKQAGNLIKRYNMRCIGCRSCVLACPFGTIFPEVINYVTSKCDYCLSQLADNPDYVPLCVKTAPSGAFKMVETSGDFLGVNEFLVGDYLLVKTPNWRFKEKIG
jgi:Fe-S-cluster-containing dehydrogenase component